MAEGLNEEAVEAAARAYAAALAPHEPDYFNLYGGNIEQHLRPAIAAYLSAMAERGERMMPREATVEMAQGKTNGFFHAVRSLSIEQARALWTAMWDAHAPTATKEG